MKASLVSLGKAMSDATIRLHETIASAGGLSGTDHKYLYLIVENGPVTAGELASKANLTTGAITGVIDRLEAKGFVKRIFDKADRRKVLIKANEKTVKKVLRPISAGLQAQMQLTLNSYSTDEQAIVERYLSDCITTMTAFTDDLTQGSK